MFDWMEGLKGMAWVYAVCAIIGGILLLVRLTLQFIGGFAEGMDADSPDAVDIEHVDADTSFTVLSLQFIMSFILMFGLVGLFLLQQTKMGPVLSFFGAIGAGTATGYAMQRTFRLMFRLQHSGTLNPANAVGAEGRVYLTIPADGSGRVQVAFQDRLVELDATSANGEAISSDTRVRVVRTHGNTMVVEPIVTNP